MKISVPTDFRSWRLKLRLETDQPGQCLLRVADSRYPNSDFLRRRIPFNTRLVRDIEVPLPISPAELNVELSGEHIWLESVSKTPMEDRTVLATPGRHRFMDFAVAFARRAGYLPAGNYPDPSGSFMIRYSETIRDFLGRPQLTPARINRNSGRVELARNQFMRFSIPVRIAILAHEACHFFLDTRDELIADRCGLAWYLDMGFPRIEAIYTATKIFGQFPQAIGPDTVERTREVVEFIQNYQPYGKP